MEKKIFTVSLVAIILAFSSVAVFNVIVKSDVFSSKNTGSGPGNDGGGTAPEPATDPGDGGTHLPAITYHANGGSSAEGDVHVESSSSIAGCMFTKPYAQFVSWNTKADGCGNTFNAGDAVTSDCELYAKWRYAKFWVNGSFPTLHFQFKDSGGTFSDIGTDASYHMTVQNPVVRIRDTISSPDAVCYFGAHTVYFETSGGTMKNSHVLTLKNGTFSDVTRDASGNIDITLDNSSVTDLELEVTYSSTANTSVRFLFGSGGTLGECSKEIVVGDMNSCLTTVFQKDGVDQIGWKDKNGTFLALADAQGTKYIFARYP